MYGLIAGCLGCRMWLAEPPRQSHSEECMKRLEKEVNDDPKLKQSRERENEFLERTLRREVVRRKRKIA